MTTATAHRLLSLQGSQALADAFAERAEQRWGPAPGDDDWGSWAEAILVAVQLAGHREDVQRALLELLRRAARVRPTVTLRTATAALAAARLVDWPQNHSRTLHRLLVRLSTRTLAEAPAKNLFEPAHDGLSCYAVELARTIRRETDDERLLQNVAISAGVRLTNTIESNIMAGDSSANCELIRDGKRAMQEVISTLPRTAIDVESKIIGVLRTVSATEQVMSWYTDQATSAVTVLYPPAAETASAVFTRHAASLAKLHALFGKVAADVASQRLQNHRFMRPQGRMEGKELMKISRVRAGSAFSIDDI